jgi:hypothetical protein
MTRDDDADNDDGYVDDDDDDDLAVALRRLELCRQEIVALRQRVARLESGTRQRQRGSNSQNGIVILAGRGPTKRPRGAPRGQQARVMRSGIR